MKKVVYSLIFYIFFSPFIFAEEIEYLKLNLNVYNKSSGQLSESPSKLTYVPGTKVVNLYYKSGFVEVALLLSKSDREKLISYLNKYIEWEKKAQKKNVYLKKMIGVLDLVIYFKYCDFWHKGTNVIATIWFLTQYKNRHQFIIHFIKTISKQDKFISFKPESLYFDYNDVLKFKKIISKDFIQKEVKKAKAKQKPMYEEFK